MERICTPTMVSSPGAAVCAGEDFSTFIKTDNTSGPETPLAERIEKTIDEGERAIIREVREIEGGIKGEVKEMEKEERTLFQRLACRCDELLARTKKGRDGAPLISTLVPTRIVNRRAVFFKL
jgi:hypothetical protein